MSSLATFGRLSGRVGRGRLVQAGVTSRGFRTSAASLAAQNFTMPALSPTMTEGNIATWRIKEGEKFSAGDVLLEIETDKATMDVEAQDEGILMKIMQGDGAKAVKVGARIAVLAEEGDDISSLEIPPDESAPKADESKDAAAPAGSKPEDSSQQPQESVSSQPAETAKKATGGKAPKQTYPLMPSVAHLIKEKGLDASAIEQMTPTGPNGRLLKGDVLAYLGSINQKTPVTISEMFERLSHLDLSNIKLAAKPAPPQKEAAKAEAPAPAAAASEVANLQLTLPVSLAAAFKARGKLEKSFGVDLPLSVFIQRAADIANDDLPFPTNRKPTADVLFDQVLGLDKVGPSASRGHYLPQISALPTALPAAAKRAQVDIIDVLAGKARKSVQPVRKPLVGPADSNNTFISLTVPKTEEKRAKVFLERVKLVLENEPARVFVL